MFTNKRKNEELSRRPRTDGSDSRANKFTYHSARSSKETNIGRNFRDTPSENVNTPRIKWWQHAISYSVVLIVIVSIFYATILNANPKVLVVGLSNQSIIQPTSVYQKAAQTLFKSSTSNRSKLTIDTDKLADQLEHQFPELNAVTIVIPLLGHNPIVEIKPSESIIILANSQGHFVINQQGNAVLKLSGSLLTQYNLPVVTDQSGLHVSLGQEVLSSNSMVFMKTVVDQFAAKNIPIQSMTLSTVPYELDVQVRGEPYYIKFNLLTDPLYSTGTYFAAIKLFSPSNPGPTQYIDVRIPGRVYYK